MTERPYLDFELHAPGLAKVAATRPVHSSFAATSPTPPVPLRHADAFAILRIVAHAHMVTVDDIAGSSRLKSLTEARRVACWVLRNETAMSFPELGRLLKKDHTSVMHAVGRCDEIRGTDAAFRSFTDQLVAAVRARAGGRAA